MICEVSLTVQCSHLNVLTKLMFRRQSSPLGGAQEKLSFVETSNLLLRVQKKLQLLREPNKMLLFRALNSSNIQPEMEPKCFIMKRSSDFMATIFLHWMNFYSLSCFVSLLSIRNRTSQRSFFNT